MTKAEMIALMAASMMPAIFYPSVADQQAVVKSCIDLSEEIWKEVLARNT